jgi:hypothetical protein
MASVTDLAVGPAVSCVSAIGMILYRLTKSRVDLIPTTPTADAGQPIEPSVSVPKQRCL